MKSILKAIRKVGFINIPFRVALKKAGAISHRLGNSWPVYGIVKLKFEDIGFRLFTQGDDHIANTFYYNRTYEEYNDVKLFLALAKCSSAVLDVGANTGLYSILVHKVSPAAKLFSFEPHPGNVARLKKNFSINGTRAEIIEQAVGDKKAMIQFYVPQNNSISDTSSADETFSKQSYNGTQNWKAIEVAQTTLDDFILENSVPKIDLVKIDVEGHEEHVLNGAETLLKQHRPVIQCEIFFDEAKKEYFDRFLKKYDYYAYMILKDGLLSTGQEMDKNDGNLNYLFSPNKAMKLYMPFSEVDEIAKELL